MRPDGCIAACPLHSRLIPNVVLITAFLVYLSLLWCKYAGLSLNNSHWTRPDNGIMLTLVVSMATCIRFGSNSPNSQVPSTEQDTFSMGYATILNATSLCFVISLSWQIFQRTEERPVTLLLLQCGIAGLCLINLARIRAGRFIRRDRASVPRNKKSAHDIDAYLRLFSLQPDPEIQNRERFQTACKLFHRLLQQDPSPMDQNFLAAVDHEVELAYGAMADRQRAAFQTAADKLTELILNYQPELEEGKYAKQCD